MGSDEKFIEMEKINVKNLVLGEMGKTEKVVIDAHKPSFDTGEIVVNSLAGKIKVIRLEDTVFFQGDFRANVILNCDRCLEKFEKEVDFESSREFEINRQAASEENLFVDKYFNIDITEPVREDLILAIPMQMICEESCKGICQKCGQNLNIKECKCN